MSENNIKQRELINAEEKVKANAKAKEEANARAKAKQEKSKAITEEYKKLNKILFEKNKQLEQISIRYNEIFPKYKYLKSIPKESIVWRQHQELIQYTKDLPELEKLYESVKSEITIIQKNLANLTVQLEETLK